MAVAESIYHITSQKKWLAALEFGEYLDESLANEGFIHCSSRTQVEATANRYFSGQTGLVLLEIDPALCASEIRYEISGDELFPHIYGPLNLDAMKDVFAFDPDDEGEFHFPAE